nr:MAG TPA: hypothetical protein [Caudoviricetes sp.]
MASATFGNRLPDSISHMVLADVPAICASARWLIPAYVL